MTEDDLKTLMEFTKASPEDIGRFLGAAKMCGYELVKTSEVEAAQRIRTTALEFLSMEIAREDMGIYPQTINGKQRTKWMEGWNAYGQGLIGKAIIVQRWIDQLPTEIKPDIENLLLGSKIHLSIDSESDTKVTAYIQCNDLFYWACADSEDFQLTDLPALQQALQESPKFGDLLWVCRMRNMRPQKPFYAYFSPEEVKLFDACGPERKE